MSTNGVGLGVVISVLGYCLLPVVGLAGLNVMVSLQGVLGMLLFFFFIKTIFFYSHHAYTM